MVQLWVRAQLGVSGVVVTAVVHHWFSCGSECYGLMVYGSGVGHMRLDCGYLVQVWFSLLCVCVVGAAVGVQLWFSFVCGLR